MLMFEETHEDKIKLWVCPPDQIFQSVKEGDQKVNKNIRAN